MTIFIIQYVNTTLYNFLTGFFILLAFWNITFQILGFVGIAKKKKEFINYYYIGMCSSLIFYLLSCVSFGYLTNTKDFDIEVTILGYLNFPIEGVLILCLIIISYCLQKIFVYDLENFYIGSE